MSSTEIITRGHLPHWYVPGAAHFVPYRLAGTLPAEVQRLLRAKKAALLSQPLAAGQTPSQRRNNAHKMLFADYDRYLDHETSIAWLRQPEVAMMIRENLYHHDGNKYHLLSYCIMPNHVHVLFVPITSVGDAASVASRGISDAGSVAYAVGDAASVARVNACGEQIDHRSPLSSIMHSLKSYTANRANTLLHRSGSFWQKESYDHWIRDEGELARVIWYIINNPVKAGFAATPQDWPFGSARDRFVRDGDTSGLLKPTVALTAM